MTGQVIFLYVQLGLQSGSPTNRQFNPTNQIKITMLCSRQKSNVSSRISFVVATRFSQCMHQILFGEENLLGGFALIPLLKRASDAKYRNQLTKQFVSTSARKGLWWWQIGMESEIASEETDGNGGF